MACFSVGEIIKTILTHPTAPVLNHPRLSLLAGTACAIATFLPAPRAQVDTLNWGTSGYTYNATTQVGTTGTGGAVTTVNAGTANANTISIQYNTASYFNNSYVTNNAATNQPSPGVGTNTGTTDNTTQKTVYTDGGTNNGTAGTGNQALQILSNFDNGTAYIAGSGITVTVFFSKPVSNLLFSFWDVDTSVPGSATPYNDQITSLTGKNTLGAFVAPVSIANGAANTYGTGTFANNVNGGGAYATITGKGNAIQGVGTPGANSSPAAAGVATVQFTGTPITQFSFTYQDTGVTGTNGHAGIQMFALSDLTFSTVPEPSTWACFVMAGGLGVWTLRRRARRTI